MTCKQAVTFLSNFSFNYIRVCFDVVRTGLESHEIHQKTYLKKMNLASKLLKKLAFLNVSILYKLLVLLHLFKKNKYFLWTKNFILLQKCQKNPLFLNCSICMICSFSCIFSRKSSTFFRKNFILLQHCKKRSFSLTAQFCTNCSFSCIFSRKSNIFYRKTSSYFKSFKKVIFF